MFCPPPSFAHRWGGRGGGGGGARHVLNAFNRAIGWELSPRSQGCLRIFNRRQSMQQVAIWNPRAIPPCGSASSLIEWNSKATKAQIFGGNPLPNICSFNGSFGGGIYPKGVVPWFGEPVPPTSIRPSANGIGKLVAMSWRKSLPKMSSFRSLVFWQFISVSADELLQNSVPITQISKAPSRAPLIPID